MKINSFCLACLINMQESQVRKFDDEEKKMAYMREILAFLSSCDPDLSAPALVKPLSRIYEKYWGKRDSMEEVKQELDPEPSRSAGGRAVLCPHRQLYRLCSGKRHYKGKAAGAF